jgi:hypothetical protein
MHVEKGGNSERTLTTAQDPGAVAEVLPGPCFSPLSREHLSRLLSLVTHPFGLMHPSGLACADYTVGSFITIHVYLSFL